MTTLVSPLYRRATLEPMTPAQQDEEARRAWHSGSDLVAIRLSAIKDDFHRQAVINEATRQYGCRPKQRRG